MTMPSLPEGYRAAVFGASGGVGAALTEALAADPRCARVFAGSRSGAAPAAPRTQPFRFDLTDEASIAAAAQGFGEAPLHLVLVATGLLHRGPVQPEKTWAALDAAALGELFAVNAIGPALVAKHTLGRLARQPKSVFAAISARVGSISDNRLGGWAGYRASKAALNQILRTLSIELARRNPAAVCLALHPGTVATPLSAPFRPQAGRGGAVQPSEAAANLLGVIDAAGPGQSGRLLAWDGGEIAP